MTAYVHPRWTRLAILPTVNNLSAPTLAEIAAGHDVSADVLLDGLAIQRDTSSVDATMWASRLEVDRPTRYSVPASLTGIRRLAGETETLWSLAVDFKSSGVLIVRRGIPRGTAWVAGQVVEALLFRYGKRTVLPSDAGPVLFRVPLLVSDDRDEAVLAA